jgi:hypothetical protein
MLLHIWLHLLFYGLLKFLVPFGGGLTLFYTIHTQPLEGSTLLRGLFIFALTLFCGQFLPILFLRLIPARCRNCQGVSYVDIKMDPPHYACQMCGGSYRPWLLST